MLRTVLAGLVVIGLAACGGGSKPAAGSKGSSAGSAKPAATSQSSAKPGQQPKRKAASDTSGARNPLTNR